MDSTVIIYGGAGAIGSQAAVYLHDRGFHVHLVGRNPDKIVPIGDQINAGITIGDVNDPALFNQVKKDVTGDISGLVYALGTINLGSIRKLKETDFLNDFKVNAVGAALAVKAALPKLKKFKGDSSIVLFSSIAAQKGFPMHASMGMAKGAVDGLVRSLAAELAPKIRVNAISPSVTQTPLSQKILSNEEMAKAIMNKHPLKRLGTASDIAKLTAFLVSEESGWITGQVIGVDGGRSTIEVAG